MNRFVIRLTHHGRIRGLVGLSVVPFLVVLLGAGSAASGQDPAAPELPSGNDVMGRFLEVSGGRQALGKLNNRVVRSTMKMQAMAFEGSLNTYQARPNKMYSEIQLGAMGTITRGTDGAACWENNPMMGQRVMEGKERALMLLLARFDELDYQETFKSVECVGVAEIQGQSCYKVQLSPKGELKPLTYYFAKDSGLLVKTEFTFEGSPAGPILVETTLSDYKEVDGVRIPHQAVEKTVMGETLITIEKVEHNVTLPADRFALPPEVAEQLKNKDTKAPTTRPAPKVEDGSVDSKGVRIHYT